MAPGRRAVRRQVHAARRARPLLDRPEHRAVRPAGRRARRSSCCPSSSSSSSCSGTSCRASPPPASSSRTSKEFLRDRTDHAAHRTRLPVGRLDRRTPDRGRQRQQRLVGQGARRRDPVRGELRRRRRQLPPLPRGRPAARGRRPERLPLLDRVGAHRARRGRDLAGPARALPAHDRHLPRGRRDADGHAPALHAPPLVRRARRLVRARRRRHVQPLRRDRDARSWATSATWSRSTSPTSPR